MYKIVLLTSGQPSLNPRLVKEANALAGAGYNVTVLYAYWNAWATKYDEQLFAKSKWKAICVGGSPIKNRFRYFISRVIHKIGKTINNPTVANFGISRATYHLVLEVRKHKADLYIAHNLGTLPAAVKAAKLYNKPCGFDVEDFHRNETSNDPADSDVIRKVAVENRYLRQVNYVTASSPQIADEYKKLFTTLDPTVILNVFNKSNIEVKPSEKPLKLFWFSQTIGEGRGIEDIVNALSILNREDIELHLLGDIPVASEPFFEKLQAFNLDIYFHEPIAPDEIIPFAAQFDIGLALEKQSPLNRDLCLTNKIFTYMQAGLAVVASNTTAQKAFMLENEAIGSTFKNGDVNELAALIEAYQQNPEKTLLCKNASLQLAYTKYNWEIESEKFLKLIAEIL